MSNLSEIVDFFQRKGVPDFLIAGIVGNLKIESNLYPGAYNAGEGAIGIVQWEGGRRTALQRWAAAHGGRETDLDMQLGFLWHEMHTTEASAWASVQNAGSVQQAAAYWDQYYERSSGEARQERINAALQYAKTGALPGASNVSGGNYSPDTTGGGGSGRMTRDDYSAINSLGDLLDQIPALRHLVDQAVANNWSPEKFQNAVENSDWWQNHSSTARQVLIEKANDPATWQQDLRSTKQSINLLSRQLGFTLTPDQLEAIANNALLTGNTGNQAWLTQQIGRKQDYTHLGTLDKLQGGMAATAQQLMEMAGDYGFRIDASTAAQHAQDILMGHTTIDTYQQRMIAWAKSAFPALASQIAHGATVKELASPYVQSMSQLLEINPAKINLYTPMIRQALQGTVGADGASVPLWQFENQLRDDPRWQYTSNAHDQIAQTALQIGQSFGFDG